MLVCALRVREVWEEPAPASGFPARVARTWRGGDVAEHETLKAGLPCRQQLLHLP